MVISHTPRALDHPLQLQFTVLLLDERSLRNSRFRVTPLLIQIVLNYYVVLTFFEAVRANDVFVTIHIIHRILLNRTPLVATKYPMGTTSMNAFHNPIPMPG
jgi:hypothetical protein